MTTQIKKEETKKEDKKLDGSLMIVKFFCRELH